MTFASLAFAYSAMAMLCAAMRKPYASLFKLWTFKPQVWQLRFIAALLLALSLSLAMLQWGATVGFSAWWVVLTVPAFVVVMLYTYYPQYFMRVVCAVFAVGLLALVFSYL